MLEGKKADLRVVKKEDLPIVAEWLNNLDFLGEYNPFVQMSKTGLRARRQVSG